MYIYIYSQKTMDLKGGVSLLGCEGPNYATGLLNFFGMMKFQGENFGFLPQIFGSASLLPMSNIANCTPDAVGTTVAQ